MAEIMSRKLQFGRLTPSQEAVYRFVSKSSRWLTLYEISKLTGVSRESARSSIREMRLMDLVLTRKRIHGFQNGEREFFRKDYQRVANLSEQSRIRNQSDIFGVEPLAKRLRRILGRKKAQQFAKFIE
jgi:DNA-binding transcriptional regulator GbsR (MarR family)